MMPRPLFLALLLTLAAGSPVLAQTCRTETEVPSTTPASRFQDNGDATVTDQSTGLMWARCPEGLSGTGCATGAAAAFTWEGALLRARDSGLAGYTDWRLPDIKELSSLVEERCYDPAINLAVFPNTPSSGFWSASPGGASSGGAWYVRFYDGYAYGYGRGGYAYRVRLVRSGQ
jgi:hypothetical protein